MPLTPQQELEYLRLKKRKALASQSTMGEQQTATPQVPQQPVYTAENPMPGAEIRPPLGDTQWYEMGDEFWANQQQPETDELSTQYLSPHLAIPTNQDALAITGQAAGRGVADLMGAPVDISSMIVNAISGLSNYALGTEIDPIQKPFAGSDYFADMATPAFEAAGYPVQDPEALEGTDRAAYNMVRFGTGAGAGGITSATRAAGMIPKTSKVGSAMDDMYSAAPVRQVVDDVATGAGAGLGVTAAEDTETPLDDLVLGILGGAAASKGTRAAESAVKAPFNAAVNNANVSLPGGMTEKRKNVDSAAELMQSLATDPQAASANIKRSLQDTTEAGMTPLTTGLAADDVGLGAAESYLRNKQSRPYLERDQAIRTDVSKSVENLKDETADITAPQTAAKTEAQRQITEAEDIRDVSQQKVREAEQEAVDVERQTEELISPVTTQRGRKAEASKELDQQIGQDEGALGQRTKVKNEKFEEAAGDDTASIEPIADSLKKVESEVNALGGFEASGIPQGFINRVNKMLPKMEKQETGGVDVVTGKKLTEEVNVGGTGEAKLKDISKVRAEINTAIGRAETAGNFDLSKNLKTLKSDINEMIDDTLSFEDAQKYYREEYAPFFTQGYGKEFRDTVQKTSERTGKADAGKIADIFLSGTPDAAADLKKIVDIAPDAKKAEAAVERYMAADLASKVGADASPRVIANWIKDRSAQLDQFPEVKAKFESLQKKAGSMEAEKDSLRAQIRNLSDEFKRNEKNVVATQRRIEKGVLGTLINKDPDKYVKSIMGGDDRLQKIDEAKKLIKGNEQAEKGFKRAVTEYLISTVKGKGTAGKLVDDAEGPISAAKISKIMEDNGEALAEIYSGKEMNVLRRAQKMLESYGNVNRRASFGSDTTEKIQQGKQRIVDALEAGLKLKYGVLKGGGIMRSMKLAARSLPGKDDKVDEIVAKAMLDPELAIHLLDTPVKQVNSAQWNKKLNLLLGVSAAARENVDVDSEPSKEEPKEIEVKQELVVKKPNKKDSLAARIARELKNDE